MNLWAEAWDAPEEPAGGQSKGAKMSAAPVPGPVVVRLADVEAERVSWLWPGRLPAGKLAVLDGDPGVGKSTLAVAVAAHVSTGTAWPDGSSCLAGDVLILSAEDGLSDTIRPRLDAAGGDPARVHALTEVRYVDDGGEARSRPPTLADVDVIEGAVRCAGAALVVVDVLMAYLPTRVDSHRDQDVRSVLAGLAALAERTGAAILLLRHLNKTSGGSPLYRGGGSIGIVGACRSALLAAPDPDDDGRRVLAATKCNLAEPPASLGYRLAGAPGGCARVEWLGTTGHRPADLLRHEDDDERGERDEAVEWLLAYIDTHGGTVRAADAVRDAGRDGIAKTTLHRARKRARVQSSKGGMAAGWQWSRPEGSSEDSEDSRSRELEPSEPSGGLVESSPAGDPWQPGLGDEPVGDERPRWSA
jgi:hypothetical protein